jgi:hypothetical protein
MHEQVAWAHQFISDANDLRGLRQEADTAALKLARPIPAPVTTVVDLERRTSDTAHVWNSVEHPAYAVALWVRA